MGKLYPNFIPVPKHCKDIAESEVQKLCKSPDFANQTQNIEAFVQMVNFPIIPITKHSSIGKLDVLELSDSPEFAHQTWKLEDVEKWENFQLIQWFMRGPVGSSRSFWQPRFCKPNFESRRVQDNAKTSYDSNFKEFMHRTFGSF